MSALKGWLEEHGVDERAFEWLKEFLFVTKYVSRRRKHIAGQVLDEQKYVNIMHMNYHHSGIPVLSIILLVSSGDTHFEFRS